MEEKNIIYIGNQKFDTTRIPASRFKDLSGMVFNNLEVIEWVGRPIYSSGRIGSNSSYRCRCIDCEREFIYSRNDLKKGTKCRCKELKEKIDAVLKNLDTEYPTTVRFTDRSGEIVNGVEILRYAGKDINCRIRYICKCHCGNEFIASINNLRDGRTLSCGCSRLGQLRNRSRLHENDLSYKILSIYESMCQPKTQYNNSYEICPEWNDREYGFDIFEKWAYENGYSEGKNILRKNPEMPYGPDNCIFIDSNISKKFRDNSRMITIAEYTYPMTIWAEIVGISTITISNRINIAGWTERDAVLTPLYGEPGDDVIQYTIPEQYNGLSGCGQ